MSSSRPRIRRLHRALRLGLREQGRARLYLAGVSMAPLLVPGQPLSVEARTPRRGEVAVYETEEGWLAHRVVGLAEGALLLRADRPGAGIERIPLERVVGVWVPDPAGGGGRLRTRLALSPGVGRTLQRISGALSHPRVLPALRRLREGLEARASRPAGLHLRRLERLEPADLQGLSALGLWREAVVSEEAPPAAEASHFWVVEAGGGGRRALGGLRLLRREGRGLLQIQLRPLIRGRGFGRALLAAAIQWAREEGLESLHAEIARDNLASRGLFLGAGFQPAARRVAVSPARGEPIDAFVLDLREERGPPDGL
ncbi:MAG: GNAT family N-acetyltransferase [Deltaproteobacteria bacterium]|nr:GNAT family N-acetyltransferase [Deltaproteobacteria bacterium]